MKKIFLASTFFCQIAFSAVVEFHINHETGRGPWNSRETSVYAKVGDLLRIYNDDSIQHQLHTFGTPCGHGPSIPAGNVWECEIFEDYSSVVSGPLYDHIAGERAEFWIEVTR